MIFIFKEMIILVTLLIRLSYSLYESITYMNTRILSPSLYLRSTDSTWHRVGVSIHRTQEYSGTLPVYLFSFVHLILWVSSWNVTFHSLVCLCLLGDPGYCLQFVFVLNKAAETKSNNFWQGSFLLSRTSFPWDL